MSEKKTATLEEILAQHNISVRETPNGYVVEEDDPLRLDEPEDDGELEVDFTVIHLLRALDSVEDAAASIFAEGYEYPLQAEEWETLDNLHYIHRCIQQIIDKA